MRFYVQGANNIPNAGAASAADPVSSSHARTRSRPVQVDRERPFHHQRVRDPYRSFYPEYMDVDVDVVPPMRSARTRSPAAPGSMFGPGGRRRQTVSREYRADSDSDGGSSSISLASRQQSIASDSATGKSSMTDNACACARLPPHPPSYSPFDIRGCTIEDVDDDSESGAATKEWLPHSSPYLLQMVDELSV